MSSTFPAGKYYVGDLCYAIAEWNEFCDLTINGYGVYEGEFAWNGGKLWTHTTAYGDGVYLDNYGRQYGVDAGLIGVLPVEFVTRDDYSFIEDSDLGHIIEFTEPFECDYEDGTFYIGDIEIQTGDINTYSGFEEDEDEE